MDGGNTASWHVLSWHTWTSSSPHLPPLGLPVSLYFSGELSRVGALSQPAVHVCWTEIRNVDGAASSMAVTPPGGNITLSRLSSHVWAVCAREDGQTRGFTAWRATWKKTDICVVMLLCSCSYVFMQWWWETSAYLLLTHCSLLSIICRPPSGPSHLDEHIYICTCWTVTPEVSVMVQCDFVYKCNCRWKM